MEDKYILKLGNLYIDCVSIDNYDSEINVSFTNNIKDAHEFNNNGVELFKRLLETFLECSFEVICEIENDNNNLESKGE